MKADEILEQYKTTFASSHRMYQNVHIVFEMFQEMGITYPERKDLYEAVIEKADAARSLIYAFKVLHEEGIAWAEHKDLYQAVIEKAGAAWRLVPAFKVLHEAGITWAKHRDLYNVLIQDVENARGLGSAFKMLHTAGITWDENKYLYQMLIEDAADAECFASPFKALHEAGITCVEHKDLYQAVIEREVFAGSLTSALKVLHEAGITGAGHKDLYQAVIEKAPYSKDLASAFKVLHEARITYTEYKGLYEALIQKVANVDCLAPACKVLHEAGVTWDGHKDLYQAVIQMKKGASYFPRAFKILQRRGFLADKDKDVYLMMTLKLADMDTAFMHDEYISFLDFIDQIPPAETDKGSDKQLIKCYLESPHLIKSIYKTLTERGITPETYPHVYQITMQYCKDALYSPHKCLMFLREVRLSAEKGELSEADILKLREKMSEEGSEQVFYGPLNKSEETILFEGLLERIAATNPEDIQIQYTAESGYEIKMGGEPTVYLNLLLMHANLSHLSLNPTLARSLEQKIMLLTGESADEETPDIATAGSQLAINYYTSERYLNMNRLFRGEPFVDEDKYRWLRDPNQNYLVNLICGALINDAANKIREDGLVDMQLIRGERLSEEVINKRTANVQKTPSVTSFSVFNQGSAYFHGSGTVYTRLNARLPYRVMNASEGEVLIPHGEQMRYTKDPGGSSFFATLVRSPTFAKADSYMSLLALKQAYHMYLSKPYRDSSHHAVVEGVRIERPNHGLAHTYRVMEYIQLVIYYFATHAKDEGFKRFCQNISPEEVEWLRVAAVFSITGRESEIAAREDLARYDEFREASAAHLMAFLDSQKSHLQDETMKGHVQHVVRYMGNPDYAEKLGSVDSCSISRSTSTFRGMSSESMDPADASRGVEIEPKCQQPLDVSKVKDNPEERQHRQYMFWILTLAHKLDLPRCYDAQQFHDAMQLCHELSKKEENPIQNEENPIQNEDYLADYLAMVRYSIELNKAHGNALRTDMDFNGKLVSTAKGYTKPFHEASTSLLALFKLSDTLATPRFDHKEIERPPNDPTLSL